MSLKFIHTTGLKSKAAMTSLHSRAPTVILSGIKRSQRILCATKNILRQRSELQGALRITQVFFFRYEEVIMARCINRNNELEPGNEFCGKCGTANTQIVKSTPGFSCPGCGGNVPEGSIYCPICGRPVPQTVSYMNTQSITCPGCGASNYPGTFYCMACGRTMPTVDEFQKQSG